MSSFYCNKCKKNVKYSSNTEEEGKKQHITYWYI